MRIRGQLLLEERVKDSGIMHRKTSHCSVTELRDKECIALQCSAVECQSCSRSPAVQRGANNRTDEFQKHT